METTPAPAAPPPPPTKPVGDAWGEGRENSCKDGGREVGGETGKNHSDLRYFSCRIWYQSNVHLTRNQHDTPLYTFTSMVRNATSTMMKSDILLLSAGYTF